MPRVAELIPFETALLGLPVELAAACKAALPEAERLAKLAAHQHLAKLEKRWGGDDYHAGLTYSNGYMQLGDREVADGHESIELTVRCKSLGQTVRADRRHGGWFAFAWERDVDRIPGW